MPFQKGLLSMTEALGWLARNANEQCAVGRGDVDDNNPPGDGAMPTFNRHVDRAPLAVRRNDDDPYAALQHTAGRFQRLVPLATNIPLCYTFGSAVSKFPFIVSPFSMW